MARASEWEPAEVRAQRITVRFDYPVVFTRGVFRPDNEDLRWALTRGESERQHKVLVVVDEGVAAAWPDLLAQIDAWFAQRQQNAVLVGSPVVLPGGEASKNDPALVTTLLERIQGAKLDRQSFVLIIGGGAVLDAAGYAASIAHRGIRVVRIPTTVLSQNDAGIGVKNGVNAFATKNYLGTFAPPYAVLNDIDFIGTLGVRDKRAGIAEAVKVACIRDAEFFDWLQARQDRLRDAEADAMATMIRRCAELHLQHICTSGDPFEMGSARPLDFGHWAAHRLEALSGHALRHGEAVAIGIALDTRVSVRTGRLDEASAERILSTLRGVGLQVWNDALRLEDEGRLAVLAGLDEFREHLGGELTVTLLEAIGRGIEVHEMDESVVVAAIGDLQPPSG